MAKRFTLEDTQIASMSKRANQRLRQMEKSGLMTDTIKSLYLQAKEPKQTSFSTTKSGQLKFTTNIKNLGAIDKAILKKKLEKFLSSDFSTVSGTMKHINKVDEDTSHVLNLGNMSKKDSLNVYNSIAYQMAQDSFGQGSETLNNTLEELSLKGMNKNEILNWLGKTKGMTTEEFENFKENTFYRLEQERDRREYDNGWNESGEPAEYRNVADMFLRGVRDR